MVRTQDLLNINYYKKEPFSGSDTSMRYYIRKKTVEDEEVLEAFVYPQPYCFEETKEEEKVSKEFPFSNEGLEEVAAWLNEMHVKFE
ncbi:hypothetical protein [Eubacterium oxidoreducens]|uniref:GNAT family acetyltransferase n=1 Tax=Eubacterium oxidoreducens TaxID=1732 RepID=A0A1G6CDS4_EUBOX|nr:hypothetical protein [Eubacterium oxidoreducens]SDB31029.1 hypothetical protein SAMN02910417_02300 [Eubacterium oxidoreducens]